MLFADETYGINETQYHIVGRQEGRLRVFNCAYENINIEKISQVKDRSTSIRFVDDKNEYTFNKSKTTLMKRFYVPAEYRDVEIEIWKEPLQILQEAFGQTELMGAKKEQRDYVILPLYSTQKTKDKAYEVAERSGLNQWNAKGRARDPNEVYIPIPKKIWKIRPDFFPPNTEDFILLLPNGKRLLAKVCQSGNKALMSNPNKALGEWILRDVLKKKEGELVSMKDLNEFGFDSIGVEKHWERDESGRQIFGLSFVECRGTYLDFAESD